MAKKSVVARNKKRIMLNQKFAEKRMKLKEAIMSKEKGLTPFDRVKLSAELSALPRNSAKNRIRNRCFITGRARGYYSYFGLSRLMLRHMASFGLLPGVTKKSL
jgi:small subunit ribosomal protein S14